MKLMQLMLISTTSLVFSACADLKVLRYDDLVENHIKTIRNCASSMDGSCSPKLAAPQFEKAGGSHVEVTSSQNGPYLIETKDDTLRRTIGVFFDGTAANYTTQTNIRRLFETIGGRGNPANVLFYSEGVGGYFERTFGTSVSLASVTGWGISRDLRQAYKFVAQNYRSGGEAGRPADDPDKLAIFGFSRGAFSARSLAGLIEFYGGIPDLTDCSVYKVVNANGNKPVEQLYLRSGTPIHCEQSSKHYSRSEAQELVAALYRLYRDYGRACGPADTDKPHSNHCMSLRQRVEAMKQSVRFRPVSIDFIGIWDTVRTLGSEVECITSTDPEDSEHTLHQTDLYPSVKYARHALSADERRGCFALRPYRVGAIPGSAALHTAQVIDDRLKEVWFAGDHSDVGGGHADHKGLAGLSLNWMAAEMKQYAADLFAGGPVPNNFYTNVFDPIHDLSRGTIYRGSSYRQGLWSEMLPPTKNKIVIHASLACRILATPQSEWPKYRPRSGPKDYIFPRNIEELSEHFSIVPDGNFECPPQQQKSKR
ncbi:DUF2235 domain-containing protein [Pyruvatibacter sp.]|uniref:DUF2235 domain-containing protein n=1 Tax=Pyruvatibacter sp. TaxID=1981328 RepID=UPI003266C406